MISALALRIMEKGWDAKPAYAAAWAVTIAGTALLASFVYLIINGV